MLINKEVQGALIETYAIGARKDLFEKPNLRIVKIFDHSSVFGVVMGGVSRKLQKCFYGYMQMFRAEIFKQIEGNIDSIKVIFTIFFMFCLLLLFFNIIYPLPMASVVC